tara:strand:- start:496 stop:1041 length:546 start_codon:yes stop_codon:yes gene_type:complete
MKTLIIILILVLGMSTIQAQKVTKLDEATVTYNTSKVVTSSNMQNVEFEVKEAYVNHFMKNPIRFALENFDVKSLNLDDDIESVLVSFISGKGYLNATFNKDGELIETSQRFRDIVMPLNVRRDIYKDNIGWTITSNLYKASGKGSLIDKELYKIKLIQGKEKRNVNYVPQKITEGRVAGY